jgi:hypothetical protein
MARKLLRPDDAVADWARRYARQHLQWWSDTDDADVATPWPQTLALGLPTEAEVIDDPAGVRCWVEAWQGWQGRGELQWQTRNWPRLGEQRLPSALAMASPGAVADAVGEGPRWRRAVARRRALQAALGAAALPSTRRVFDALADAPDDDFARLAGLLQWALRHPSSGLYLRQLPVEGMDTKWLEQRRGWVAELAAALPGAPAAARDLHSLLGLTRPPLRLRLRVLCPGLRRALGGLGDIEAPLAELAALPIAPTEAIVVENLESALALPDRPGAVALMKLGHAVGLLGEIAWLRGARVRYWGDIDTHGFAILDRARGVFPDLTSLLMDRETLWRHRALWVDEAQPYAGPAPARLTAAEQAVYDGLVAGSWGTRVRLEQERIPWAEVLQALG